MIGVIILRAYVHGLTSTLTRYSVVLVLIFAYVYVHAHVYIVRARPGNNVNNNSARVAMVQFNCKLKGALQLCAQHN